MNEAICREYRERVFPKLTRYLKAEGLDCNEYDCLCPNCGESADLLPPTQREWSCAFCGRRGDVLDYARLQYPQRDDWDLLKHICKKTGVPIDTLEVISGEELSRKEFPPQCYLADGFLPKEGLFLLAAPAKTGKSWLVLQLASALVKGEDFLTIPTHRTQVLYLSLEDHDRRLQERTRQMGSLGSPDLFFATQTELLGRGFEESICRFLEEKPGVGLVIVDTLQKIRECTGDGYSYARDYDVMNRLKAISQRFHIAILLVHHTNKIEETGDEMNRVSGTTAMTGGVDGTWVLRRPDRMKGEAVMQVSCRDIEDMRLRLRFDKTALHWEYLGMEEEPEESPDRDMLLIRALQELLHGDVWFGSTEQLNEQLKASLDLPLSRSPSSLGRWLSQNKNRLWNCGIGFEQRRQGNSRVLTLFERH